VEERADKKEWDFCAQKQSGSVRTVVLVYITYPDASEVYITVSRRNSENGTKAISTSTNTHIVWLPKLEDRDQGVTWALPLSFKDFLPSDIIALAFPKRKDGSRVCDTLDIHIAF